METQLIGNFGEDAACEYLKSKGYLVIQRNFRCKSGEVDIICAKDGCTVFVEVKTRKSDKFGRASEYVDFRKQEKLRRAALYFIKDDSADMRFDVIEVYHSGTAVTEINHIEDAF